jgi:hypothetical protein
MSLTAARKLEWSDLTDAELRRVRTCFHEAGHAVAGVLHGGELRTALVAGGRVTGLQGSTRFTVETLLADHPAAALAGPWAEARLRHGRRPDWQQVLAVLAASGRRDRDTLFAADTAQVSMTLDPLLERCWGAIASVARRLWTSGEAHHEHVLSALGLTRDTAATGLSQIRAGSPPGSFTVTPPAAADLTV